MCTHSLPGRPPASPPTGTWACPPRVLPHAQGLLPAEEGAAAGASATSPPPPCRSGALWLPRFPLFPFGRGPAHLEAGSAAAWERFHQLGPRNAELFNLSIPRCTEAPGCLGPAAFGTAALDKQRRPRPAPPPAAAAGPGNGRALRLHQARLAAGGGPPGAGVTVCVCTCVRHAPPCCVCSMQASRVCSTQTSAVYACVCIMQSSSLCVCDAKPCSFQRCLGNH